MVTQVEQRMERKSFAAQKEPIENKHHDCWDSTVNGEGRTVAMCRLIATRERGVFGGDWGKPGLSGALGERDKQTGYSTNSRFLTSAVRGEAMLMQPPR